MERKNIRRNIRRTSTRDRPKFGGSGFGNRLWFPQSNLTPYEKYLIKLGIY